MNSLHPGDLGKTNFPVPSKYRDRASGRKLRNFLLSEQATDDPLHLLLRASLNGPFSEYTYPALCDVSPASFEHDHILELVIAGNKPVIIFNVFRGLGTAHLPKERIGSVRNTETTSGRRRKRWLLFAAVVSAGRHH